MLTQVQDHDTSDLKDYVPRYPANYSEPLWPDGEPIADALALMARLDSNIDPTITGLPAQANIIEHAGRDENALLPTVAPSEGPGFLYQEPEVRQIVSWGESHASASTDDANMADQPVPHDGLGFVEEEEVEADELMRGGKLSRTFDPAYDLQSPSFFLVDTGKQHGRRRWRNKSSGPIHHHNLESIYLPREPPLCSATNSRKHHRRNVVVAGVNSRP